MPRKPSRKEERQQICEEWRKSGLSRTEFCKQRNMNLKKLYRWLWEEKRGTQPAAAPTIKFLPLTKLTTIQANYLEVLLPNGIALKLTTQPTNIVKLIKELL
jgi:hypothetical protein